MTTANLAPAGRGRLRRIALTTALHATLIVGPLAAYLIYQHGHAGRVEASQFRAIAGVATETSQRLDHLRHLFSYANTRSASGSESWLENARVSELAAPPARAQAPAPQAGSAAGSDCAATPIEFALDPGPAGARVRLERPACPAWQAWCACPPLPWPGSAGADRCAGPSDNLLAAAFAKELDAETRRYAQADMLAAAGVTPGVGITTPTRCTVTGGTQADPVRVARALGAARRLEVPLADLLTRSAGPRRFGALLVLDGQGTVVQASDGGWPVRIDIAPASAAQVSVVEDSWLPQRPGGRADLGALYAAPLRVTRAGTPELLFCTPLQVRYAQAPALTLCGAVPASELQREARALAPDLLALVVLVFLLSVCAVPLLKVYLIGPHEAFRRTDMVLAAAGAISAGALITVLLAWAGWSLTWRARLDIAALEISDQARGAFAGELADTAAVLDRLAAPGADVAAIAAELPAWGRLAFRLDSDGQQVGPLGTAKGLGGLAAPAQVANRAYFRNARKAGADQVPIGTPARPRHAAVEQVLMRGHGLKATAFAVPVTAAPGAGAGALAQLPGAAPTDPARVAVLLRDFDSLAGARLPAGFRLVVFDARDGTVQFHTDPGRALAENFFVEMDTPGLRDRLHAGQGLVLRAKYSGAPYRFDLRPLHPGWPWWIAVGRQEGLWRAAGFDLVAGALPVIGLLLAGFGAVALGLGWAMARLGRVQSPHALAWLWPQWGRRYGWRVLALAVLLGLSLTTLTWPGTARALTAACVLGVAGIVVVVEAARPRRACRPGRAPVLGYLGCLALLLALVGVLPAAAVMRDLGTWVEAGYQRVVLRDYQAAPGADAATAPGWYFPPALVRVVGSAQAPAASERPGPTACRKHPGACVLTAGVAPDLSDAHVEVLRQAASVRPADERSDERWRCGPLADGAEDLVCSPRLAGFLPSGGEGAVLVALAVLLGFLGIRFFAGAADRLFCFAMGGGRLPDLKVAVLPPETTGHALVVRAPAGYGARLARVLAARIPAPRVRRVDLRTAELDADGNPRWPAALATSNDVVILEEFDTHPRDPRWSQARLELLEKLLFRPDLRVIVLTDMSDPSRIALDVPDAGTAELLGARWAAVLRELTLVRYPAPDTDPPGHPPALRTLDEETGWSWRLEPVAAQLRDQVGFADLPESAALSEITARAWPYYRHQWSLCTRAERLVLAQLAHGTQPNPRQYTLIRQLLRRGLVRREPEFRLAGEGFAAFVREAVSRDEVNALEQAGGGAWQSWRAPLLVAVLVGGALLFVTQRDTFQAAYALGAAGLAAVPVLVRAAQTVRAGTRGLSAGGSAPDP